MLNKRLLMFFLLYLQYKTIQLSNINLNVNHE